MSLGVEDRIILASAGTRARRHAAHECARLLLRTLDWEVLTEGLRARRLLPTLGPRILELAEEGADAHFAAAVYSAIDAGRVHAAALTLASTRTIAALAQAGISSTLLKGPLLGQAVHGDSGRRYASDIDLLVKEAQLPQAVEVVRGLGYNPPTDHVDAEGLPLLHFALVHERLELPTVELHWRVHWYERSFAHERLLAPLAGATAEWRPAPADELAALLLYYARDGFAGLRLATDISAWWDVLGDELQPGALGELLGLYPELARVLRVAVVVAEKVVGLPAKRILGTLPRLHVRELLAARLADPNPRGTNAQIFADMGLIDGLLAPTGGFAAFLRRQVIPPREVLDGRATSAREPHVSSPWGHSARVLARYGIAMTRVLRVPPQPLSAI
jgi:hypothetical protein